MSSRVRPADARAIPAPGAPDVAVLLPTLYGVRNLLYGGVVRRLSEAGVRMHLFPRQLPPARDPAFADFELAACEPLEVPRETPRRGRAALDSLMARAFAHRNRIESYRLYRDWFRRNASPAERLRGRAIDAAGVLAASPRAFSTLQAASQRLYRSSHDIGPIRRRLEALAPRMLWSTTCTSPLEYPYYLAARDLGIPVVASILSFDNLTSRSVLPTYDHYLVWSDAMKRQVLALYPEVSPERVTVTGTPQFDFHRRPEFRWSRAETLRRLGLPDGARYVLYAASHESLAPDEPELVRGLAARMAADPELEGVWLAVRMHPQDDGRRWADWPEPRGRMVLSPACDAYPDSDGWKLPRPEEQGRLIGSLLHAEACLNIVSTMSLDAAVLDRPVIGIEFSAEPQSPRDIMYSEYGATHFRPLVASQGLHLGRNWAELLDLIRAAVADPGRDRANRQAMASEVCGPLDGRSAERVASEIRGLLDRLPSAVARKEAAS